MKVLCFISGLLLVVMVSGCGADGEDVVEKSSFQMPVKENTWVRKETLRKSKDDMFKPASEKDAKAPIDSTLAAKLKTSSALSVSTLEECLNKANALDKRRHEIQNRGGVWGAYEREMKAKPYSNDGMQIDSQTNRLIFSLKHICKNSQEPDLSGWEAETVRRFEDMGKEGFRNYFLNLGEASGDVDKWVKFAEFSIHSRNRNIPFSKIGESLGQAKVLIDMYDDLSKRTINGDADLQTFVTEGATLLSVINESFKTDPRLVLALQDENILPFEDIEGEM